MVVAKNILAIKIEVKNRYLIAIIKQSRDKCAPNIACAASNQYVLDLFQFNLTPNLILELSLYIIY